MSSAPNKITVVKHKDFTPDVVNKLIGANCDDVFSYLGLHQEDDGNYSVRCLHPGAKRMAVCSYDGLDILAEMQCLDEAGLFYAKLNTREPIKYLLKVIDGNNHHMMEDCYRFPTLVSDNDLYLFGEGTNDKLYEFLGAHIMQVDGVDGCRFAVWAPNASRVSVIGDFNFWDGRRNVMRRLIPSGVWEIFIPGVDVKSLYKYEVKDAHGNLLPEKSDPFGFAAQKPPEQASVVADHSAYVWRDADWMKERGRSTAFDSAISVYEVHIGSWRRVPEQGYRYLNYRELASSLIPYVKEMEFTHIQLMPVSEYPFDGSWGYQPVGLYAPTSRYGSVDDFKFFVDECHLAGIAVLADWVPGHFPTDTHGLGRFDGTPLYEHADFRQGFHPDWNTYIFNYGRKEVVNYLKANALFWLDKFHIDGLRVDAVASMLYLDYSRKEGEWIANSFGGRENLDAIDFLKAMNERVYANFPTAMMVAEESTAWPGVSKPTYSGGLGFSFKWNMGWMNDSLDYISKDPVHRKYHHNNMTFSLLYAFSENFVLPISHDEVVHGKGSVLARMPGDAWQKFANIRAYYAYMWTHPGKKLLFMGCEFAQGTEWDHDTSLSWHQLEIKEHAGVKRLVRDLNVLYKNTPALYDNDADPGGFEWIEADERHNSIFIYIRYSKTTGRHLLIVANMTPVMRHGYRVGVNAPGNYSELMNTDSEIYGGSNQGNSGYVTSTEEKWHSRNHSILITVPPLAVVVFGFEV